MHRYGRTPRPVRVAVVGAGNVGATFAQMLLLNGTAAEIVLIDSDRRRAEGEAMDLQHTEPFTHPTKIWAGDFADCADAEVTVIAAGRRQREGETRLDLLRHNSNVLREVVPRIVEANPSGMLIVATSPVDALTWGAWKLSGLPRTKVLGSGTILDTARFRYLLSQHLKLDPRSVHAYVIGEHGDSEVPLWSLANVTGMPLEDFCWRHAVSLTRDDRHRIFQETRGAAYEIIRRKGSTYFAVAAAMVEVVEAIVRNEHRVFCLSTVLDREYCLGGVAMSVPVVVGAGGIERIIELQLESDEFSALLHSAQVIENTISEAGFETELERVCGT
jgi:L-lactate dehydrogenase